jgi:hypothetical protein
MSREELDCFAHLSQKTRLSGEKHQQKEQQENRSYRKDIGFGKRKSGEDRVGYAHRKAIVRKRKSRNGKERQYNHFSAFILLDLYKYKCYNKSYNPLCSNLTVSIWISIKQKFAIDC